MCHNQVPLRIFHRNWSDYTATIFVESIERPLQVLHLTDSHLMLIDDRDSEHLAIYRPKQCHWGIANIQESGSYLSAEDAFAQILDDATKFQPDLIAVTGDLISFPSQANIEHAAAGLNGTGLPWMFTSGNHDWVFTGQLTTIETREAARPLLAPLHKGSSAYSCREIGGLQFLGIDNSNYQIDQEQLEFTRTTLATGKPTVLLTHIPFSTPTLREPTMHKFKNCILLCDYSWELVDQDKPGTSDYTATTLEFVNVVTTSPNLVAILCGHVHFAHADPVNPRAVQYVTAPGYLGRYRVLNFRPFKK